MTRTELIKKLQEHLTIEEFAYNEIPSDNNNFSENAIKAQVIKDQWIKDNPNPGYGKVGYDKWQKNYQAVPSKYDVANQEWLLKNNIPEWIEVEQYGGEGQGDTWYSVKHFPSLDIYLKVDGYYQSYNGTNFNGIDNS